MSTQSSDGTDVKIIGGKDAAAKKKRTGLSSKMADSTSLQNPARDDPIRQFWYPVMFTSKARRAAERARPPSLSLQNIFTL